MREITVILIFFPLVVTDFTDMYQLHPEYEKTKRQMIKISEMLEPFAQQTIKHSFDEWISQHKTLELPSESILGKKISFFNFIMPGVDIFRFANLRLIQCFFKVTEDTLLIQFGNEFKNKSVTGNVQILRNGNSSSCEIPFEYTLNQEMVIFDFYYPYKNTSTYSISRENIRFEAMKRHKELCQDIDAESQSIYEDVILQATNQRLTKMIVLFSDSVFKSINNECRQPRYNYSDKNEENHYSYLKPHGNMATFPWTSDHDELFIKGLSDSSHLYVSFKIMEQALYALLVRTDKMKILWNTTTIMSRHSDVVLRSPDYFPIFLIADKLNNSRLPVVFKAPDFLTYGHIIAYNFMANIIKENYGIVQLTAKGIEDAFQSMLYDGIVDFVNMAREIIQPLDKHSFETSFTETETNVRDYLETASYYKIKIEGFKYNLQNITCNQYNNLKIGKLSYEKIKGQVEHTLGVEYENNFIPVSVSANVYIRKAFVNILLHSRANNKYQIAVDVDDNFDIADTTIMITSKLHSYQRNDRIAIGKLIRKQFVEIIRNKIKKTANSMFNPIINVCSNSLSSAANLNSNHSNNRQHHFAIIYDEWIYQAKAFTITTRPVTITINGLWNLKFMTIQFVSGNVIFHDIRIDNVTGSIEQLNDSNKMATSHYNANYLSMTISLKDRDVRIKFPADSKRTSSVSIWPEISSSVKNIPDMVNKLTSSVASFIKHSIFRYDSSYSVMIRKSAKEAMKKAILDDTSFESDTTLNIIDHLVNWLKFNEMFKKDDKIEDSNYIISQINISMAFQHPYIKEDTCDHHPNSGDDTVYLQQFTQQGNIVMRDNSSDIRIQVPYKVNIKYTCTGQVSSFNPDDEFHENGILDETSKELHVNIDEKNITIQSNFTEKTRRFALLEHDILVKKIVELTNSTLQKMFNNYNTKDHWFCKFKYAFPVSSEQHFYSITKTVNYTSDHFLMYHIKLYGLQNLKSHRRNITSDSVKENEITATNLKANVIWTHYIGDSPPRTPKKTSFRFDISLVGELKNGRVTFGPRSQIQFSDRGYPNTSEKLRKTLGAIIMSSIQHSIKVLCENEDGEERISNEILSRDNLDVIFT